MPAPSPILTFQGQRMDTIFAPDGTPLVKVAVGLYPGAGDAVDGAGQLVGTHAATGAALGATDAVVVLAGVHDAALDGPTGDNILPVLVDDFGRVLAVITPARGLLTNRSGSVATGATAQQLMAANTTRRYMFIQNLDSAEVMWINFTTDAVADQPSIRLGPLDAFVMEGSFVSTEKVTVLAATTGHKYAAKEA